MLIIKEAKAKMVTWAIIFFACFLMSSFLFISKNNFVSAQTNSADAIAVRILQNPDHLSALVWYKKQGFTGSPQSITVDGYEGVRDGRTVYVNVANIVPGASTNDLYTDIYLISYNQTAGQQTTDIFARILSHWKFNSNIIKDGSCRQSTSTVCKLDESCKLGDFCDSPKARVIRDVRRLSDLYNIKQTMSDYHASKGGYPKLDSGTYISHRTYSVWPSWKDELNKSTGGSLAVDPVNKIGDCPGYNSDTCWNEQTLRFITTPPDLPNNSLLYSYYYYALPAPSFDVCAVFESGLNLRGTQVCSISVCLDFDRDGYGSPGSNKCTFPQMDCNDSDPNIGPSIPGVCGDCGGFINCNEPACATNPACIGNPGCVVDGDCINGENCNTCPADCGPCLPTCPDGTCDASCNECQTCYGPGMDCSCGDSVVCTSRLEQCDLGAQNGQPNSGCSANCRITSTCVSDPLCTSASASGCTDAKTRWDCTDNGNGCLIRQSYPCLGNNICSAATHQCVSPCLINPNCNPATPPPGFNPATAVGCGSGLPYDWHYIWRCQQDSNSCWNTIYSLCPNCPQGQTPTCDPSEPAHCDCVNIPCTPTCTATPGCLAAAPANSASAVGACCGNTNCYTCAAGYTWGGGACNPICTDTCASLGYQCGIQTVCGVAINCPACTTGICCGSTCEIPDCTSANDPICNDNDSCTNDVCNFPNTCNAVCAHTQKTTCANGDGCCPNGCTNTSDNDCPVPPDDTPPTIIITTPTPPTYTTNNATIVVSGTATDNVGVTNVTCANSRGGGCTVVNTGANWSTWSISNITLSQGDNIITVTGVDAAGNPGTANITITYNTGCTFTITFPCTF